MRHMTGTRFCAALLVALAACQQVKVSNLGPAPARPPLPTASVRLFYSREAVPFRYDEIALLSMDADWLADDREDIYRALRKRAGEIGANAVIVAPIADPTTGEKVAAVLYTSGGLRGNAIAVFLHLADSVTTPR